jgi:hypothetical protein
MGGMTARRPPRRRRRPFVALAAATVAVGSFACAEPALPDTPQGEGAEQPVEASAPDPARDALLAQLHELRATIAAARDELATAMDAADASSARRAGDRALAWLLDDPDEDGVAALFPSTTTDRGDLGTADVLTLSLTAARDAGGTLGRSALELLRDPIAGDLGTWQRDPAGVVASVESTIAGAGDLTAREQAVLELPGEGTRALAWALLTADARDADTAAAYAERGLAHLDLILLSIDDLLATHEDGERDDDGGEGGADDDDGAGSERDDDGGEGDDGGEPTEEDA